MLLQNGYRDAFTSLRYFGAGTTNGAYPGVAVSNSQIVGSKRNIFASAAGIPSTTSIPDGCRHPVSWVMPQKPGGLSCRNNVYGSGSIAADILAVKLAEAGLTGSGDLDAIGSLIVQALADMTGSGEISDVNLQAFLSAVANLTGSGTAAGTRIGLGALISALVGSGTTTGSTATGTGELDADLVVTGTGLTTGNVGQAVWAAIAAANNTAGTMGEKLNDAGAAGNPWAALTAANNDPDTFGELIQIINTLTDELHKLQGLNQSAPMTVTPSSRTAGDISLTLTGDGITETTVTRD